MGQIESNEQRKAEIKAHRRKRQAKIQTEVKANLNLTPPGSLPCDPSLLKPYNSYGVP